MFRTMVKTPSNNKLKKKTLVKTKYYFQGSFTCTDDGTINHLILQVTNNTGEQYIFEKE